MSMFSYGVDVNTANTETFAVQSKTSCSNNFIIGCDLEVYANAEKDAIFSGYNSLNDDIFCQMQLGSATVGAVPSLRFDFYALYDSLLICEKPDSLC